jgi:hypothetical protein
MHPRSRPMTNRINSTSRRPMGGSANRSLSHTGPVSGTSKRKLENGEQRLTPESHWPGTKSLKIAGQRLGHISLTRRNVLDPLLSD